MEINSMETKQCPICGAESKLHFVPTGKSTIHDAEFFKIMIECTGREKEKSKCEVSLSITADRFMLYKAKRDLIGMWNNLDYRL